MVRVSKKQSPPVEPENTSSDSDSSEETEWCSDIDEEDDDDDDETASSKPKKKQKLSAKEIGKQLAKTFILELIGKKGSATEEDDVSTTPVAKKSKSNTKPKKESKNEKDENKNKYTTFFIVGDDDEDDEDYMTEDESDSYSTSSEDEFTENDVRTFMKEHHIDDVIATAESNEKGVITTDAIAAEEEYIELVELRKHLKHRIEKKPSKVLTQQLENCNTKITELVKKTRKENVEKYYKQLHDSNKRANEMMYFKTKLSYQEQLQILNELQKLQIETQVDKPYRIQLLERNIPIKIKSIAFQKMNALRTMSPDNGEYFKLQKWVEGFMKIPFGNYKNVDLNFQRDGPEACHSFMTASKVHLDECVYGLDEAKAQIFQLIGQWITNPNAIGTAVAIHGPPGTGKTSLVRDGISKIMGREFAFVSLGGAGDGGYLEGHSYTYEGSVWGKIAQILMDTKTMNPVIMFDELDKVSDSPRGQEIVGILTHLIDSSQNSEFQDKYFSEFGLDLSRCLFIFTYNNATMINPILLDRMYSIKTKGYETKDKIIIAKRYLLPKIAEQVGLNPEDVIVTEDALMRIINTAEYTMNEDGVRNLKRCLEVIFTKLNLYRLTKPELFMTGLGTKWIPQVTFPFTVTREVVDKLIHREPEYQSAAMASMYI